MSHDLQDLQARFAAIEGRLNPTYSDLLQQIAEQRRSQAAIHREVADLQERLGLFTESRPVTWLMTTEQHQEEAQLRFKLWHGYDLLTANLRTIGALEMKLAQALCDLAEREPLEGK